MGACEASATIIAVSAAEGFNTIVDELREEYGSDGYNGTLSTCTLTRTIPVKGKNADDTFKKASKQAWDDMNSGFISKWEARAYDCGPVYWEVIKPSRQTFKSEPPKFETMYIVKTGLGKVVSQHKTKTEAVNWCKNHIAETSDYFDICKERVRISGSTTTDRFRQDIKRYKSKPKRVAAGATLVEYHRYYYMGLASC